MLLKPILVELRIVEGGEAWGQAPESADEPKLSDDYVDDETKLCLSCKLESVLGLALDVAKRICCGEQHGHQSVAGIDRIFEVADLLRRGKGVPQQFDTVAQVL